MAATEQIYKAMSSCWSDDVYLADLSPRFWRLTLQILSRYKTWLDAHLPDYVVKDAIAAAAAASASSSSSPASAPGLSLQRVSCLSLQERWESIADIMLNTASFSLSASSYEPFVRQSTRYSATTSQCSVRRQRRRDYPASTLYRHIGHLKA